MKKFLTLAVLAIASLSASAQWYLGGTFGVNRNDTDNTTSFTLAPEFGYGFNDTWSLGGTVAYQYKYLSGLKSNLFSLNPYARWTFARVADDKLHFFVDGGLGLGIGSTNDGNEKTAVTWNIGFKPGVSYNFNEHWTILAHIGFLGYNGANDAAERGGYKNSFGLDFSTLNLNLGVYYNF